MSRATLNSLIVLLTALLLIASSGSALSPPPIDVDQPSIVAIIERSEDGPVLSILPSLRVTLLKLQSDGRLRYRILDDDLTEEQVAAEPQWVRDAYHLPRSQSPWIVAANSRTGVSTPLPTDSIESVNAIVAEVVE